MSVDLRRHAFDEPSRDEYFVQVYYQPSSPDYEPDGWGDEFDPYDNYQDAKKQYDALSGGKMPVRLVKQSILGIDKLEEYWP